MGIDNGALGSKNQYQLFDPTKAINDTSLPKEFRDDLRKALDEFAKK